MPYCKTNLKPKGATTKNAPQHQSNTTHCTLPPRQAFFGRTAELAQLAEYLLPEHRGWGVVLDGPGGIGKTALAVEAAYRAPAELYPCKVFVTAKNRRLTPDGERLHSNDFADYHALLTALGLALGCDDIQRIPQAQQTAFIRNELAKRKVLLVLDNLESLAKDERRQIYDLLERLPAASRALVTSRRRDETAARYHRLDKLDFTACQQLLAELGERLPTVAKLNADQQQRLYAETGGNPLLLTWTAGQLGRVQGRCRTVDEAVERLREAHKWAGSGQDDDENRPLEFVFGDLLETFTDDETAVLAALVHFTQPAKLAWLLPLAKLSHKAAETALDDLNNRALLLEDEANGTWLLPPLVGHFLRLRCPHVVGEVGERLAAEVYALAVQHGYSNNAPFTELEAAWPIVQAALPLLIVGDNMRLQKVCEGLSQFLDFSGRWDVRLNLNLEAKAKAKALARGDDDSAGWCAYNAGWVYHLQNDANAVVACAERCTQHWQNANAGARKQAIAIHLRGDCYKLTKNYPKAIQSYKESLLLYLSLNPESGDVSTTLNSLATVKQKAGDWDAAEADYQEALRIAKKMGYPEGVATFTGNLADLALDRTDWLTAERLAREALTLAQKLGRLQLIASNHHYLSQALLNQQRPDEALPHAQEAVTIFSKLPRSPDLADAQATLEACLAARIGIDSN